jgi:hypothetical protein
MINYCRKVNVPLPRDGKKSLLVSGDNLVLVVSVQAQPTKLFRTGTRGALGPFPGRPVHVRHGSPAI